jgi:hypothetical protein
LLILSDRATQKRIIPKIQTVNISMTELPTAGAELPTAATELPTAVAKLPTAATELPTAGAKLPTAATELPTAVAESKDSGAESLDFEAESLDSGAESLDFEAESLDSGSKAVAAGQPAGFLGFAGGFPSLFLYAPALPQGYRGLEFLTENQLERIISVCPQSRLLCGQTLHFLA